MLRVRKTLPIIVFVVAILAGSVGARAAAIFTFVQSGGDVVGTLSGSLNLSGASAIGTTPPTTRTLNRLLVT